MRIMKPSEAKRLIGRTIVAVDLRSSWEGKGGARTLMHDPIIRFDDGSVMMFMGQEHPDGGELGVGLIYARARPAAKPARPSVNAKKFLGSYPCSACERKHVRVYEWLPEAVLCASCQRSIVKQERAAESAEHDDYDEVTARS